ncbi:MAG: sugar phosphate isomerase/epimerase [Clostridia bacterium]|nr:sugar phosphate isomerase/epimerase [Clostridia bacterium]
MKFGLNLYSLRKQISTKDDFIKTALRLKAMGYDYIQFSGAPFDKDVLKEVITTSGLPVVLTHSPLDKALNSPIQLVDEHKAIGCDNIGLGWMDFKNMSDADVYKNISLIKTATDNVVNAGGKYFYHNHNHEFLKLSNGKCIFDEILDTIPNLNITLDTFWLQAGGVSILDYISICKGRLECVHLKDFLPSFKEGEPFTAKFAPVGYGNINFEKVISAMQDANVKYYLVEQDDATDYDDPFGQVELSIKYLKNNF